MNDETKEVMRDTLARVKTEIEKLQAVQRAMEAALSAEPGASAAPAKRGPRAPKGALEEAILGVLTKGRGLVNKEIRAKLKAAGYKFSLDPLHIGKTLVSMADAGDLKLAHDGTRREYSLK